MIQRFDLFNDAYQMIRRDHGDYVLYADHLTDLTTLLERCEKAEAEVERQEPIISALSFKVDYERLHKELAERQRDDALKALEPFVAVLEQDISADETDEDIFQPMREYNRAPLLTIGHFRTASAAIGGTK